MIDPEGFWTPPEDATPEPETQPAWLGAGLMGVIVLVLLLIAVARGWL